MKNNGKKSRRVQIDCVSDLIDALVEIEENVNGKLFELGINSAVKVEEGVDLINVKIDDNVVFSMKVTDANASAAFGPLKNALERAKKSIMPKAEEPEVVADVLPQEKGKKLFKRMDADGFNDQLSSVVNKANARLAEIRGGSDIKDVFIAFAFDGGRCIVSSGDREIADEVTTDDIWGSFKRCRSAIWKCVDDSKPYRVVRAPREVSDGRGGSFAERLDEIVKSANEKLAEIGEDPITVTSDSVGVYLAEGTIPLCSIPKGVGSADDALNNVEARILKFVDEVRGVVDRRKHNVQRAKELEADSAWDMAILERANPEIDKSELYKLGPNAEAASAIVDAAKKSVKSFNASLRFKFEGLDEILGDNDERKMSLKGFTRGIVVSFGEDPCFISMFPLVGNNASVEETAAFVGAHIASIGDSRMKYYARIYEEYERKNKLVELSAKKDALEAEISAMAM